MPRTELFIGNLNKDTVQKDIEEVFEKYGKLVRCDVKNKGMGNSFCFLEFEEERDAEDAINAENGKEIMGNPIVVEWAKGKSDRRDRNRFGGDRRGGGGGRGGRGGFGGGRGGSRGGLGGGRSLECYNCGGSGHFARDCRKGGEGGRPGRGGGGRFQGGGRDNRRNNFGGGQRRERSRSRSPN